MKTFKYYILPLIPIVGLIFIIKDFHSILDQYERPFVFITSSCVQALSLMSTLLLPHVL